MPHRLVVSCPDRPGIVASVSQFLFEHGANILHSDQHTQKGDSPRFFLRIEFEGVLPSALDGFEVIAQAFAMTYSFTENGARPRLAVFVSKEDHCLQELLLQTRNGDISADIKVILGNHPDLAPLAESFRVPFYHVPMADKADTEARQLELIGDVELIVLARYMQIVSANFLRHAGARVINIHHSFLPAFAGANPYRQAYDRGVKIIGATAHYATADLDEGPIIEQDVTRVDHRMPVAELRRIGRQIERAVLARSVKWHTEDRVFLDGDRTVVFS